MSLWVLCYQMTIYKSIIKVFNVSIMDKESFPRIDLFPRLTKIGKAISGLVRHLPHEGYPSDHHTADIERDLGHKVLSGEITAQEAYERLGD